MSIIKTIKLNGLRKESKKKKKKNKMLTGPSEIYEWIPYKSTYLDKYSTFLDKRTSAAK